MRQRCGRAALVGGCVGGGGALLGCPGVLLLGAQAQAVWVAPRHGGSASDLPVDLGLASALAAPQRGGVLTGSGDAAAAAEEWRLALIDVSPWCLLCLPCLLCLLCLPVVQKTGRAPPPPLLTYLYRSDHAIW